eukprot:scaffold32314_cov112-Isochrysis_galbana.AAC.2
MLAHIFGAFVSALASPYLGFAGLHGRDAEHSFSWSEEDHHISMSYRAAHPPGVHILKLDEEDDVLGIHCIRDRIYLRLRENTTLTAALGPDSLITGSANTNCTEGHGLGNGVLAPIMRAVVAVLGVTIEGGETIISLRTEEATHLDFFSDLDLKFHTNILQDATRREVASRDGRKRPPNTEASGTTHIDDANHPTHARYLQSKETLARRENSSALFPAQPIVRGVVGWMWEKITQGAEDVKHMASEVIEVLDTALDFVSDVVNVVLECGDGACDFGPTTLLSKTWSYNYDGQLGVNESWSTEAARSQETAKTVVNIDAHVQCTNCFAVSAIAVVFELKIQAYNLQEMRLMAEGHAKVNVEVAFSTSVQLDGDNAADFGPIKLGDIKFFVAGIPVVISTTIPIRLGYSLDVRGSVDMSVRGHLQGHVKYGMSYKKDRAKGDDFQVIAKQSFSSDGAVTEFSASVNAHLEVYIMPVVKMRVHNLGGPDFGMKVFLAATLEVGNAIAACGTGVQLASAIGLQMSIGASINLNLPGLDAWNADVNSLAVFSGKWPLPGGTGCVVWSRPGGGGGGIAPYPSPPP